MPKHVSLIKFTLVNNQIKCLSHCPCIHKLYPKPSEVIFWVAFCKRLMEFHYNLYNKSHAIISMILLTMCGYASTHALLTLLTIVHSRCIYSLLEISKGQHLQEIDLLVSNLKCNLFGRHIL
jgi:hypothetical protein